MTWILALPVLLVVVAVIAIFLAIGAAVAGIEGRSYGKAFVASGVYVLVSWVVGAVLTFLGVGSGLIPFVLGVVINLYIIKSVFSTSWGKAIVAWLIQLVATVIVIGIPLFFLVGVAALSSFK